MTFSPTAGIEVEDLSLPVAAARRAMVRIFRCADAPRPTPVVLYLGEAATGSGHDDPDNHQVRGIATDTRAAVLVPGPEQDSSGNDLEPIYDILRWIAQQGQRRWLDGSRVALAGEGSGAELCARLALLVRQRGTPAIRAGSLLWATNSDPAAWHEAARFLSAALQISDRASGIHATASSEGFGAQ